MPLSSHAWSERLSERFYVKLLLLLLFTDVAFMALHLLHVSGLLLNEDFAVNRDRGYAEIFQYTKFLWGAALLAGVALRERQVTYLGWSLVFAFMLLDDSLRLHEEAGTALAQAGFVGSVMGLDPRAVGQVAFVGLVGAVLLALLGGGYALSRGAARQRLRRASVPLLVLVGGIGFCGVFVDLIHGLFPEGWFETLLHLVEDGGEMAFMSLCLAYIWALPEPARVETRPVPEPTARPTAPPEPVERPRRAPTLQGRPTRAR